MQVGARRDPLPRIDQPLMNRIILVGSRRNKTPLDRLLEPRPLEHRGFEDRGRSIRIVFEQLCRAASAEGEVQPTIKARLVVMPACGDERPEAFGDLQALKILLVADRAADEL